MIFLTKKLFSIIKVAKKVLPLFVFILISICNNACSLFETQPDPKTTSLKKGPTQTVFFANKDVVWRAAKLTLKYPLVVDNEDAGVLETEYIKAADGWVAPGELPTTAGVRYKIIMQFVKGRVDGRESTRVTLNKKMEILKDFFSEPEPLPSDGLEEKVILYRMNREIIVSETLRKVQ